MTRLRRTKDELARGISAREAEAERILLSGGGHIVIPSGVENPKPPKSPSGVTTRKGEIIIRIRPAKGVESDYFEHLTGRTIDVEQDDKFYSWLDHYAGKVYDEHGQKKLFQDLLDQGIGELIKNVKFTRDICNGNS